MSEIDEWRWADANGDQHALELDELRRLLQLGALPAYALVWRPGWAEWLEARHATPLGAALGSRAEGPIDPLPASPATPPPQPPLSRYFALGHPHGQTLLNPALASLGSPPVALPPPPVPIRGAPAPKRRQPVPVRDVQPTIADDAIPQRSNTLRPAGALPPPPRALPPPGFASIDDGDRRSDEVEDGPASAPSITRPASHSGAEAHSTSSIAAGESKVPNVTVWLATVAGLVMASVGIFMLSTRGVAVDDSAPTEAPGVSADSTEPGPPGCTISQSVRRLAPSAQVNTPLLMASSDDGTRVAVGYASTDTRAVGIQVALGTLEVEVPFQKAVSSSVVGVVPRRAGASWQFAVDEERGELGSPRTVAADPPFVLGIAEEGIARRGESGASVVWPGELGDATVPRVASVETTGHAVALRTGGRSGAIRVGWLTSDGTARTELGRVEVDQDLELGTPAITASATTTFVTFAAKRADSAEWHVEMAAAPIGRVPGRARAFPLPSGGPGGSAISPSATPIPGDRFLLQWTEGSSGARLVRAQPVSSNLEPTGETITLSPPGENAGQGALWTAGSRVLALFLVQRPTRHELWGATLTCR